MKPEQSYNEVHYGQISQWWDVSLNRGLHGREHTINLKHECHERLRDSRMASRSTCVRTDYLDAGFCVITLRLKKVSTDFEANYQWLLPLSYSFSYLREELAIVISDNTVCTQEELNRQSNGRWARGWRDTAVARHHRGECLLPVKEEASPERTIVDWDMETERSSVPVDSSAT